MLFEAAERDNDNLVWDQKNATNKSEQTQKTKTNELDDLRGGCVRREMDIYISSRWGKTVVR
jgi:hypothetical protein